MLRLRVIVFAIVSLALAGTVPTENSVRVATRSRPASKPWGGRVDVLVHAHRRPLLDERRPVVIGCQPGRSLLSIDRSCGV